MSAADLPAPSSARPTQATSGWLGPRQPQHLPTAEKCFCYRESATKSPHRDAPQLYVSKKGYILEHTQSGGLQDEYFTLEAGARGVPNSGVASAETGESKDTQVKKVRCVTHIEPGPRKC